VSDCVRFRTLLQSTLLALLFADFALAQSQKKGDGSIRVEYQYIHTGAYKAEAFVADYWTTDSHIALISGDYALSERWSAYVALPYVQKRFVGDPEDPYGGDPHNPNDPYWVDFDPPDKRFIDDEDYHGGFQDFAFGLAYLAVDGPAWQVSPYIGYGFPADNYPFFAKAAIGANLWNIPVGVSLRFIPFFSDWHFRGNLAYVFSEKPLDVNVDYWRGFLSAGYWFKPNFSLDVFLSTKYIRNGLILPWDYTDDPNFGDYPEAFGTEKWYNHDRLLRHRILNLGIGLDYFVNAKYQLSGSFFKSVWSDQTNEVDYAFSLALTRFLGSE
jgi:hypothetical protein